MKKRLNPKSSSKIRNLENIASVLLIIGLAGIIASLDTPSITGNIIRNNSSNTAFSLGSMFIVLALVITVYMIFKPKTG